MVSGALYQMVIGISHSIYLDLFSGYDKYNEYVNKINKMNLIKKKKINKILDDPDEAPDLVLINQILIKKKKINKILDDPDEAPDLVPINQILDDPDEAPDLVPINQIIVPKYTEYTEYIKNLDPFYDINKCLKNLQKCNNDEKIHKNFYTLSYLYDEYIEQGRHSDLFDDITNLLKKYLLKLNSKNRKMHLSCTTCNTKISYKHSIEKLKKYDLNFCKKCNSFKNAIIEI
jgi:hypothetical protein